MKIFTSTIKLFTLATALFGMSAGMMGQVLSEDFTGLAGNNTSSTGSSSAWPGNDNFTNVERGYQAGDAVKVGTGSNNGSITTKELDLSANNGGIKVEFEIKGWTTVEGSIVVSIEGGASQTLTYSAKMGDAFEKKEVTFSTGGTATSKIKFETSVKRAFLDNIKIFSYSSTEPAVSAPTTHSFSTILAGTSATESINIKGANLTGDISVTAPTAPFTTTVTTITKEQVMAANGFDIPVTFAPTAKGNYTSKLTITSPDIAAPIEVNISAIAYAIEEVTNITALRAKWTGAIDATTYYKITGESLISFANGKNYYMQDAQSGLLVYDVNTMISPALATFDGVSGIVGKLELYNAMLELIITNPAAENITHNNTIAPVTVAADDYITNFNQYEGRLVKIENVAFPTANGTATFKTSAENLNVNSNGQDFIIRTFANTNYANEIIPTTSDVTGVAVLFNSTKQLSPRFKADISTFATAISNPTRSNELVYIHQGQIIVKTETSGGTIEVFNVAGQRLVSKTADAGHNTITLPKGQIYIVKIGSLVKKVVL